MKISNGSQLFVLTSKDEGRCFEQMKDYFDQMFFAN